MANIPNPPNAPAGFVAQWNGSQWVIVPLSVNVIPSPPTNLPSGYSAEWNGTEWVIIPPPAAPTNRDITEGTIVKAAAYLQQVAGLATQALQEHISVQSAADIQQYIHDVGNILAVAQTAYVNNEAYTPDFPPMPTLIPAVGEATPFSAPTSGPFIQFVVEQK